MDETIDSHSGFVVPVLSPEEEPEPDEDESEPDEDESEPDEDEPEPDEDEPEPEPDEPLFLSDEEPLFSDLVLLSDPLSTSTVLPSGEIIGISPSSTDEAGEPLSLSEPDFDDEDPAFSVAAVDEAEEDFEASEGVEPSLSEPQAQNAAARITIANRIIKSFFIYFLHTRSADCRTTADRSIDKRKL